MIRRADETKNAFTRNSGIAVLNVIRKMDACMASSRISVLIASLN
jgi:hypothetical protein